MATIYDIIEENNRRAKMEADVFDVGNSYSEQDIRNIDPRFMGSAPSNDINQIILNNIAQLSDANEGNIGTDDVLQEPGLFQRGYDYLSGGVVDLGKNLAGSYIASQALGTGGGMFNPYLGIAGLVFGGLKGVNMFDRSQSQINFDNLSPKNQEYTSSLYGRQPDGTRGLLQGYNQISDRGVGALGTLQDRLGNIQNRKALPTPYSRNLSNQIQNAINNIITEKDRTAGMNAPNNIGLGGGGDSGSGDSDAGYSSGQSAGMGFGGGRSDPTDKS